MTGRILSSYAPDNLRAGSSNRSGYIAVIDICCILETCNSSNGGVSALNPGCVIIASLNTAVYKATVCWLAGDSADKHCVPAVGINRDICCTIFDDWLWRITTVYRRHNTASSAGCWYTSVYRTLANLWIHRTSGQDSNLILPIYRLPRLQIQAFYRCVFDSSKKSDLIPRCIIQFEIWYRLPVSVKMSEELIDYISG